MMLPSNATEHASSIAAQQCHGRTDGRTDADALTVRVKLTTASRAGGHGILRSFGSISGSAAASRADCGNCVSTAQWVARLADEGSKPRLPRVKDAS